MIRGFAGAAAHRLHMEWLATGPTGAALQACKADAASDARREAARLDAEIYRFNMRLGYRGACLRIETVYYAPSIKISSLLLPRKLGFGP